MEIDDEKSEKLDPSARKTEPMMVIAVTVNLWVVGFLATLILDERHRDFGTQVILATCFTAVCWGAIWRFHAIWTKEMTERCSLLQMAGLKLWISACVGAWVWDQQEELVPWILGAVGIWVLWWSIKPVFRDW